MERKSFPWRPFRWRAQDGIIAIEGVDQYGLPTTDYIKVHLDSTLVDFYKYVAYYTKYYLYRFRSWGAFHFRPAKLIHGPKGEHIIGRGWGFSYHGHDDTPAVQKMLDHVAHTGGIINLPDGEIHLGAIHLNGDNVELRGAGKD